MYLISSHAMSSNIKRFAYAANVKTRRDLSGSGSVAASSSFSGDPSASPSTHTARMSGTRHGDVCGCCAAASDATSRARAARRKPRRRRRALRRAGSREPNRRRSGSPSAFRSPRFAVPVVAPHPAVRRAHGVRQRCEKTTERRASSPSRATFFFLVRLPLLVSALVDVSRASPSFAPSPAPARRTVTVAVPSSRTSRETRAAARSPELFQSLGGLTYTPAPFAKGSSNTMVGGNRARISSGPATAAGSAGSALTRRASARPPRKARARATRRHSPLRGKEASRARPSDDVQIERSAMTR